MRSLSLILGLFFSLLAFGDFSAFLDEPAHRALCSALLVCGLCFLYHGGRQRTRPNRTDGVIPLCLRHPADERRLLEAVEALAEALKRAREEEGEAGSAAPRSAGKKNPSGRGEELGPPPQASTAEEGGEERRSGPS